MSIIYSSTMITMCVWPYNPASDQNPVGYCCLHLHLSLSLSGCSCRWGNVWICNLSLCLSERQIFLAKSVSKSLRQTFLQNQHWKPAFETETVSFIHINAPLDTQHKLPQKHSSYVRGLVLSKDSRFQSKQATGQPLFLQWSLIQRGKDHSNCPGQRCRGKQESH